MPSSGSSAAMLFLLAYTGLLFVLVYSPAAFGRHMVRITPVERETAVRAARTMGLNVCGVDVLRSNHGPVVMEVNSSPGLEGIEEASGKDIAGMIVKFIETNAKEGKTRTRGKG